MRYPYKIGERVVVDLPNSMGSVDETRAHGVVVSYTPRGVRVRLDDGRARSFAWWRLVRE